MTHNWYMLYQRLEIIKRYIFKHNRHENVCSSSGNTTRWVSLHQYSLHFSSALGPLLCWFSHFYHLWTFHLTHFHRSPIRELARNTDKHLNETIRNRTLNLAQELWLFSTKHHQITHTQLLFSNTFLSVMVSRTRSPNTSSSEHFIRSLATARGSNHARKTL